MPLRTYRFEYSIDGILTELPTYITVQAKNMRKARRAAEIELKKRVREYTEGYWEWVSTSFDGPWTERYVPGWSTKGHLYEGYEEKPIKPRTPQQREQDRKDLENLFQKLGLGNDPFAPIQEVIENAPVLSELFKTPLPEIDTPVIPMEIVRRMPRHLWPRKKKRA